MTATTTRVSTTPLAARRPFWESPLGQTVRELARNHAAMVGLGILVFWILVALTVSFIVPFDPLKADVGNRLSPPGASHWFGTDDLGRDVFKRVLFGSRYSILAGFLTVLAALLIGCAIGALAGYLGGWIDNVLMRIADMVLAFPSIVLAMAIAAAMGPGLKNALIAIVVVLWPEYARLMRGQVLAVKANEYVTAAEALGAGRARLLVRHILPNTQAPIVVKATLDGRGGCHRAHRRALLHRAGSSSPRSRMGRDDPRRAAALQPVVDGYLPRAGDLQRGHGAQLSRRWPARRARPAPSWPLGLIP